MLIQGNIPFKNNIPVLGKANNDMEEKIWMQPDPIICNLLDKLNIDGFTTGEDGLISGTDKNHQHNYTGIFAELLKPYLYKQGTLLEIGIQHGGSSLLWHEYLPGFKLFLSDIQNIVPSLIWDQMDPNRYNFYKKDAFSIATVEFLKNECVEGFDIVIEDGPHTLSSQLFAIEHYYPMLKPGGILIIEDIQDIAHLDVLTNAVPQDIRKKIQIFDNRASKGRSDDVIWSIVN